MEWMGIGASEIKTSCASSIDLILKGDLLVLKSSGADPSPSRQQHMDISCHPCSGSGWRRGSERAAEIRKRGVELKRMMIRSYTNRSSYRMILRSRIVYFLLIVVSSFSFAQSLFAQSLFAQSTQAKPQTSEDKRVKTSTAGKPVKPPSARQAAQPQPIAPNALIDEKVFGAMRWRQVGPFRGGRVLAVTGVPGEPNVFYFGAVAGGVWKSTDAGANWQPLFDKQDIASIGAIAVAPSDHNVIYVGTGEAW